MGKEMPTGLYTRWRSYSETELFKIRTNRIPSFENMVISFCQESRHVRVESFYTEKRQKMTVSKMMASSITVKQYST